ncbi:MAG: substrate-binding domain-containing protein, partial [Paracoccaceae bacterium]
MKRFLALIGAVIAVVAVIVVLFQQSGPQTVLRIVSGSENQALEPLVQDWAAENNVAVEMTYLGSVDISRALGAGKASEFDAVWPAHSLWIALGDSQKVVAQATSILRSPVVLGLKTSL